MTELRSNLALWVILLTKSETSPEPAALAAAAALGAVKVGGAVYAGANTGDGP
jgi:hypothetical protein